MLTLSPTQPPDAPGEQQISQEAARQMLAALIEALPYVECAENDPHYKMGAARPVILRMISSIRAAEGRAS